MLRADDLPVWIDERFLRHDPAAFAVSREPFTKLASRISQELAVDRNGIFCIGSGATGLSINPEKIEGSHLKTFDDRSDIDLAIISAYHFETAWRDMLRAAQPHLQEWPPILVESLAWQKKRIFDGAILAHVLLPVFSFGPTWQSAMQRVAEAVVVTLDRNVDVNFWIYRDYWSLRNYVSEGIVKCQRKLRVMEGGS